MLPKSNQPYSAPLKTSERRVHQQRQLRQQTVVRSTALLCMIGVVWLIETALLTNHGALVMTKSVALGGVINWMAQAVFTWFVFRSIGGRAGRQIVNYLYIGLLVKWIIILVGFASVFIFFKSLLGGMVLVGYILMQFIHFIILWRIR